MNQADRDLASDARLTRVVKCDEGSNKTEGPSQPVIWINENIHHGRPIEPIAGLYARRPFSGVLLWHHPLISFGQEVSRNARLANRCRLFDEYQWHEGYSITEQ